MLNREGIAGRIPHRGSMCLLERVVFWNAEGIECEAGSHRDADNPLRAFGRLGIAAGIEYAAQAMAVHGALAGEAAGLPGAAARAGYLASVRSVRLHAARLDDVPDALQVHAMRLMGDENNIVYSFALKAGQRPLLEGRATVVLDASLALRTNAAAGAGAQI
ncbi:MAG: 3-hydroxylacyl-ACP dehydratase [Comamonadaceae bacterium]|nr:MAG: 3-hydroxylacyl-ACP dehydratase [Comamonadaceae bacterium]